MGFLQWQILIFLIIVVAAFLGGKRGAFIASLVWIIETIIAVKIDFSNYLQIITVGLAVQISFIIAVVKDLIVKFILKNNFIKNSKK